MTVRLRKSRSGWRKPLNKLLPPSATEAKKLQKQLMHAGYRSAEAPIVYRAIQLASMAGFPLLVAGVCALTGATAEQCVDLHHSRVCRRFLPAALLPGPHDQEAPATDPLGTRGCARLDGCFS